MKKLFLGAMFACLFSVTSFAGNNLKNNTKPTSFKVSKSNKRTCKIKVRGTIDGEPFEAVITFTAEDDCVEGLLKLLRPAQK